MPVVLLVRHGETDWNRTGQIMGEHPIPLNPNGEHQVTRLAEFLRTRSIHAMYSSPVARARQTANMLSSAVGVPVTLDRGLTEIGVGDWAGRFWSDISHDLVRQNFYSDPEHARPPGGETLREVQVRAVSLMERVIGEGSQKKEDGNLLVFVSHADVVRVIVAHYLGLHLQTIRQARIDHASLTALKIQGNLTDLLFLNHTADPPGLK